MSDNQVRKKCRIQDREGFFKIERATTAVAKVRQILPDGQFGEEEEVTPDRMYDIRQIPRVLKKAQKPAGKAQEVFPADRPEKRVCTLQGDPDTRYHLLRRTEDQSKVLKVGEAGTGHWIPSETIEEYFDVPAPGKPKYPPRQPVNICNLQGREGVFLLLRKGDKGARVVQVPEGYYGETVPLDLITNEQKIDTNKLERQQSRDSNPDAGAVGELGDVPQDGAGDPGAQDQGDHSPLPMEMSAPPSPEAPVQAPNPAQTTAAPAQGPNPAQVPGQPSQTPNQPHPAQVPGQPQPQPNPAHVPGQVPNPAHVPGQVPNQPQPGQVPNQPQPGQVPNQPQPGQVPNQPQPGQVPGQPGQAPNQPQPNPTQVPGQPPRPQGVAPRPPGVNAGGAPRPQPGQAVRPQPAPPRPQGVASGR